ncbi:MAG: hypothetical protein OK456_07470 [Thaumarchaeota archaeon]|nr:hypothetical protein [Nitrososphaerota archaeon]
MTGDQNNEVGRAALARVGLAGQGAESEVLAEMLDHQGIVYDRVTPESKSRYPVILTPARSGGRDEIRTLLAHGGSEIAGTEVVELGRVQKLLSGVDETPSDEFTAFVNEQEEALLLKIRAVLAEQGLPLEQKWFWPGFAKAACILTHDLDWLVYSPYHKVVLRSPGGLARQPALLYKRVVSRVKFGWNVPETISAETSAGFKSSFFVKTKYERAEQPRLAETVRLLKNSGADVGLHAARASYRKEESLRQEMSEFNEMFGHSPNGVRQHILKFEVPKTWRIQASCGLEFDATFSHTDHFGFRAGVCLPYRPLAGGERLPITELPTSFMDWTYLHRRYDRREVAATLKKVTDTVERHHGVLVVNFHNTYLDRNVFPDIWDDYLGLLEYLKSEKYWVATASECVAWWIRRNLARPTPEGGRVAKVTTSDIPLLVHEGPGLTEPPRVM